MKYDQSIEWRNVNDSRNTYNDFYASVSVLFRIASFLFLIAFLVFIVYSAFGSHESVTYDNFEFIVRNFALTLDEKRDKNIYTIRYNPDSSRSFALLGNNFTLCGNSGVSIYSSTGRLTCSDSFAFKNPVMVTSDKYALIYDSGNCDYVIYNSFTEVHSQTLNKPIRGACMSQNGYYALITSSDEYNSTVEVYNDDFKLINRFNKSGYIVDVDMHDDQVLIATVEGSGDHSYFVMQILMYDVAQEQTVSNVEITASFPLSCKVSSSGFFLICKEEAITYDISSDKQTTYSYNGSTISDFDLTSDRAALLLDVPGYDISYNLVVIDDHSSVMYDGIVDSTIHDIELCGDSACLLTDNRILVINSEITRVISLEGATTEYQLLAFNSEKLYLCTSSSAPLLNINE